MDIKGIDLYLCDILYLDQNKILFKCMQSGLQNNGMHEEDSDMTSRPKNNTNGL